MSEQESQKDIIHFSHANGFPAKTYEIMLAELANEFQVGFINTHAHDPDYPVDNNWQHLVTELEQFMERCYDKPVIAVGHSFGGVLSYMLACKRPDLIKQLIILDAPVLDPVASFFIKAIKRTWLMDKITPAGRTDGRQENWPNAQAAIEYFQGKSLFKNVDERCLAHYVEHAMEPFVNGLEKGIKLIFSAQTEVSIYRTIPDNLKARRSLDIPCSMIHGEDSDVVYGMQLRYMENKLGFHTLQVDGGHLFPLEQPEYAAQHIINTIKQFSD